MAYMDFQKKSVFISGPMTGKRDWNREAFAEAERLCEALGARLVHNPSLSAPSGEDVYGHEYWMRKSLRELCACKSNGKPRYDYIVQLEGWKLSKGAKVEAKVASACGIEALPISAVRAAARERK